MVLWWVLPSLLHPGQWTLQFWCSVVHSISRVRKPHSIQEGDMQSYTYKKDNKVLQRMTELTKLVGTADSQSPLAKVLQRARNCPTMCYILLYGAAEACSIVKRSLLARWLLPPQSSSPNAAECLDRPPGSPRPRPIALLRQPQ